MWVGVNSFLVTVQMAVFFSRSNGLSMAMVMVVIFMAVQVDMSHLLMQVCVGVRR